MHAASGLFFWSMELLAFVASRLFATYTVVPIYHICLSIPYFLVSERSGCTVHFVYAFFASAHS